MANRPAPFNAPDLKRALKVALDVGLTVTAYEIGVDGRIIVRTQEAAGEGADAALDAWKRRQNGHRKG